MRVHYGIMLVAVLAGLTGGCGQRAAAPAPDSRTLVVWAHEGQPAEKLALRKIVDDFNAGGGAVRARLEFKPEQGYGDRVNAAAIAGGLPDILEVDGPYTAHFAAMGILRPLTGLLPESVTGDFLPTIIQQGTWDGKLYTLGAFESTVALFYDKARLAACGITPPAMVQDAWSWAEFMDVLEAVRIRYPAVLPLETFLTWGGEWLTYAFMPLIWSNDGAILAPDGARASGYLNAAPAVAALQNWQQLFLRGYADANAAPGRFQRGEAIMALGVFNRWPIYQDAGTDFGMSPYPGVKHSVSPSGSWCWGITAKCRAPEAAATVLRALLDARQGVPPICQANGGVPARRSALAYMPDYEATRGLFVEQLRQTARARPVTPAYGTLTMEISRALDDIARGADVQKSLDDAARRIDAVLAGH